MCLQRLNVTDKNVQDKNDRCVLIYLFLSQSGIYRAKIYVGYPKRYRLWQAVAPYWTHDQTPRPTSVFGKKNVQARRWIARGLTRPRGNNANRRRRVTYRRWHRWCGNETPHQMLNPTHMTRAWRLSPIRLPGPVWRSQIICTSAHWTSFHFHGFRFLRARKTNTCMQILLYTERSVNLIYRFKMSS